MRPRYELLPDRNDGGCGAYATGPSAEANVAASPCLILELLIRARNYVGGTPTQE